MPENILVVEYEPRYTDRVRQALAGQPFAPSFAKDGEEALRSLEAQPPKLIVLSSVVPKISTAELIRAIRGRKTLQNTPILITVSGYSGKSPKQDALRMGASDILPKPYSETEFLSKIQEILGAPGSVAAGWGPEVDPEFTVRSAPVEASPTDSQLTSNDIFGELLDDEKAQPGARKTMKSDDLDKMLADTLAGVRPAKKRETVSIPVPPAASAKTAEPKRSQSGQAELDKMLQDTLSGLERRPRPTAAPTVITPLPATPAPASPAPAPAAPIRPTPVAAPVAPVPAPVPVAPPPVIAPPPVTASRPSPFRTDKIEAMSADRTLMSHPVVARTVIQPLEEDAPTDGVKFGQYVLVERIATGGMAEVWKARMRGVEGFQKIVAIKKILPHLSDNQDFIEMFIDEAKLAAQLNHNNIIHIYDLGKIQSSYYIAMEYVDGHDLKTILKRGEERDSPMTVELALFIASKIAAALDYAHRKRDFEDKDMGLVHRDVSPQNVLVSEDGDIKLCDFGIAKAASKASHTQAGALKGKLQYMSPEQAWGRNIDKRSDIFALATVLYEMLTGRKLFTGDNELSILEQVREARVVRPSDTNDEVPPEVDAIVRKALEKDPANRYQTAGEMAKDLDAVLYSMKPTPTSADLAIYMHRIWGPEPVHHDMNRSEPEPVIEAKPVPVPLPVAAPVFTPAPAVVSAPSASFGYEEPAGAKKPPLIPIAIGVAVVLAIVVGFFMLRSNGAKPAVVPLAAKAATPVATTAASTTESVVPVATATLPVSATTATSGTSLDQAKINEEVQKRLKLEREKLDQQARAQTPAPAPQTATVAPRPAAVPQTQVAESRPAPPPAPETRPTPAPAVQQPVERPAPQSAAPEVARVREGELVPAGAEGLNPAHLIRRAQIQYPPMAKLQHVEGRVVMSVLVSETGQVMDVKIISGEKKAVGLNEAAEQSVRRSTFTPGTKDGVRVKSWTTVPVDFKL